VQSQGSSPLTILDFDLENRPLNYLGNDWTGAEITAIAWAWVPELTVECLLLTRSGKYKDMRSGKLLSPKKAFTLIREQLIRADIVTGHYIRKHDLPMINAHCMEAGIPTLPPLLASDTKCELVARKDLSASQENLAGMLQLAEHKHHMSQAEWREANRLTSAGLQKSYKRVTDDVIQHMALRKELVRRGLLKTPKMWRP
jgi:hypothetical protein